MNDVIEPHLQRVYLSNALDQVLANPTAVHTWHQLAPWFAHCGPELQAQIFKLLKEHTPADGVAGFLRASFCASLLQETAFFAEAGKILLNLQPQHLDRLNAFVVYAWSKLLAASSDMTQFVAGLQAAQVPQLIGQMQQMVQQAASTTLPPRRIDSIQKVALITPHMGNLQHAPTRLLLNHVALLMDLGIEVEVFCCQEMRIPHMPQLLGNGEDFPVPEGDVEQWSSLLPAALKLHLGHSQLGLLRRFVNILEPLASFDPDLVLTVGMYSPLQAVLFAQRPLLALGVHAIPPIASCDAWLCNDKTQLGHSADFWGASSTLGKAHYYPYRIKLPAHQAMHRYQLDLPEHALVLVCVGYRLAHEISGEWAERMLAFLHSHTDTLLLLVGSEELPSAWQSANLNQVRNLPHQAEVGGILDCCDIYVNPTRIGGGFSVLEAMASALPVLALAGADGGNKLGDLAQANLDAYFQALETLHGSSQARTDLGNLLRARFYEEFDLNQAGPSLLAAAEQARLAYLARTAE